MDMTPEEMALYQYRVGRSRFESFTDAKAYCQACYSANCVEALERDGSWKVFWIDGDFEYLRPGFGRIVQHRPARREVH